MRAEWLGDASSFRLGLQDNQGLAWLGKEDKIDYFDFDTPPGKTVSPSARRADNWCSRYVTTVSS